MTPLLEIRDVDRTFYRDRLAAFLPERIVDIHTHVWRRSDFAPGLAADPRVVSWPDRVAAENTIEDLLETYRLMLPGKSVVPLVFAMLPRGGNTDVLNEFVQLVARRHGVPSLLFTEPGWSAHETERRLLEGRFKGAKSYLTLAPGDPATDRIRVFDFFPAHQLEVLDRYGLIMMLHLPRSGRLKDRANLADLLEIERRYPGIRLVVAHVGRAYCEADIGNAFDVLAASERICFDISANTNATVFEELVRCVGPRRILFGSDLPVTRMRMRRVTRDGRYVNLVPKGMYGDVSVDPYMDEVDGAEAERLTYFLYEEIDAFRRAAEATGLTPPDVDDVFFRNAERMLRAAGAATGGQT